MQKLKVHENGKNLILEDGTPFFYLGDTAWEMFQRLTKDEVEYYMSVRARQGFNVVQAIALSGSEPYECPNKYGRTALKAPYDSPEPDTEGPYSYWDHIEWCVSCAERYGIYFALLPMWSNRYNDPDTTIFKGYEVSRQYGRFLGERFRDHPNIIWMLGGDVDVKPYMHEIFDGLAAGIRAGEGENNHLFMFHPGGLSSSVGQLGGDKPYLDFHSVQSGHSLKSYEPERFFPACRAVGKPFLDTEAHYEDHAANWHPKFRRWDAADIRMGAYRSVFSGACGETYGNPLLIFFLYEPLIPEKYGDFIGDLTDGGWFEAMRHEGANTIGFLKKLCLSRNFLELRPAPEMVTNAEPNVLFGELPCARGEDYAFVYSPMGREIRVDTRSFPKEYVRAAWFDPRTGEESEICYMERGEALFVPETRGRGNDWVLVLDNFDSSWMEKHQLEQ